MIDTIYVHCLARSILYRRGYCEVNGEKKFLQAWQVFDELCKIQGIHRKYDTPLNNPETVFLHIIQSRPSRLFHSLSDESYSEVIIGICHTLKLIEHLTDEEQKFLIQMIDKWGSWSE